MYSRPNFLSVNVHSDIEGSQDCKSKDHYFKPGLTALSEAIFSVEKDSYESDQKFAKIATFILTAEKILFKSANLSRFFNVLQFKDKS